MAASCSSGNGLQQRQWPAATATAPAAAAVGLLSPNTCHAVSCCAMLCCVLLCRFVEALRAAVRHTSKGMGAYVSSKLEAGPPNQQQQQAEGMPPFGRLPAAAAAEAGQRRPFPYVVPIVAKSAQLLFEETGRASKVSGWLLGLFVASNQQHLCVGCVLSVGACCLARY